MALRINNNVASLNVQRSLGRVSGRLQGNFEKLSSGQRINRAADDAAGLAISERLRAQISSLGQASRNASDGVSMIQTAEGALGEMNNLLIRMRELSTQAANGTLSQQDRNALDSEFQALSHEIDRIAETTDFAGISLLDSLGTGVDATGLTVGIRVDTGIAAEDTIGVLLTTMDAGALGVSAQSVSSVASANAAITALDTAIQTVNSKRSDFGAMQNRIDATISNLSNRVENFVAAESRIRDVDIASESAKFVQNQILQQAATSILAQANMQPQLALSLLG
jgi:flagellin